MKNLNEQVSRMKYLISRDIDGDVKPTINEDTLEYDPAQVVHKDEDVVVIDLGIDADDTGEYEYDEEDISFEDDDWLVVNPDDEDDQLEEGPNNPIDGIMVGGELDDDRYKKDMKTARKGGRPLLKVIKMKEDKDYCPKCGAKHQYSGCKPTCNVYKKPKGPTNESKTYKISEAQLNLVEALLGEGPKRKWRKRAKEIRKNKA